MRTKATIVAMVLTLFAFTGGAMAQHEGHNMSDMKKDTPSANKTTEKGTNIVLQTTCSVMGGKINKKIFADYDGKRVYFCCGGCPAEFKKDPAKYVKLLEDQGVVFEKTPVNKDGKDTGSSQVKETNKQTGQQATGTVNAGHGCCQ